MTIVYEQISSLASVDIDGLFDGSFPDIDQNFFSKVPSVVEYADKKAFYLDQLELAIAGNSPLWREGDTFFMFKGSIDGVDCVFNAGFVNEGSYRGHWYLCKVVNASKAWIFTDETTAARNTFFGANGIVSYKAMGHTNSNVISAIRRNAKLNIINETIINIDDVELTIEV